MFFLKSFPFGFLIEALFFFAVLIVGIIVLVAGWRRHSRKTVWIGSGTICWVVAVVGMAMAFDAALGWNPLIVDDAQIVGTWAEGVETLTLAPDKTFSYRVDSTTSHGTRTRDDWNLYLHGDTFIGRMEFIEYHGRFRLLLQPPSDPDAWDGNPGLARTQKP